MITRKKEAGALLLSLALIASAVAAQTPGFEVASVRPAPGPGLTSQRMTDSRVDLSLISMRALLLLAFRAKSYELAGPDWLADTRVSIQATMPPGSTRQQVPEMLQRLLAEQRSFESLTADEWRAHSARFDADVMAAITPEASVRRKRTPQSTHPDDVGKALHDVRRWIDEHSAEP